MKIFFKNQQKKSTQKNQQKNKIHSYVESCFFLFFSWFTFKTYMAIHV